MVIKSILSIVKISLPLKVAVCIGLVFLMALLCYRLGVGLGKAFYYLTNN